MRAGAIMAAGGLLLVLVRPAPALAQDARPHAFVEVTAAINATAPAAVNQDRQFTEFLETADVASIVRESRGVRAGGRAGWWITSRVGIAGGVSILHATGTVEGTYTFPSPFVFNMPVVMTTSSGASRVSVDTDVGVIASLVDARGWQVTAGAGPDVARVRQQLLADVQTSAYAFPFTAISVSPASGRTAGTGVGVRIALDVSRHIGRRLDLTGTIDWRRTRVRLTNADGTVTIDPGGATAGGGLRLRF